jgi:hypothetical protein
MFDGTFMSKDVMSAVVALLPVLLLAFVVAEGANMSRWRIDRMERKQRRAVRRSVRGFIIIVAFAMVIEIQFLFALNEGNANGLHAFVLWASGLTWLGALTLALLASVVPPADPEEKAP